MRRAHPGEQRACVKTKSAVPAIDASVAQERLSVVARAKDERSRRARSVSAIATASCKMFGIRLRRLIESPARATRVVCAASTVAGIIYIKAQRAARPPARGVRVAGRPRPVHTIFVLTHQASSVLSFGFH